MSGSENQSTDMLRSCILDEELTTVDVEYNVRIAQKLEGLMIFLNIGRFVKITRREKWS